MRVRTANHQLLPALCAIVASLLPVSGSIDDSLSISQTELIKASSVGQIVRLLVKPNEPINTFMVALGDHLETPVEAERQMSGGTWVVSVASDNSEAIKSFLQMQTDSGNLEYAQIDASTHIVKTPNDRLFQTQWQHRDIDRKVASMDLISTWDLTTGSEDIVVAVIDTGVRYEHKELANRLLEGYDFVSAESDRSGSSVPDNIKFARSNDQDGRDADASDPGDGVDEQLHHQMDSLGIDCPVSRSSWHGTGVASILAANGDDGFGIAGVDWQARILPVRAVGRCSGNRSDLLDAIRWAAGVQDPALPPNPTPARIINVSIEIKDACGPADQQAINDAVAAGAIIVAGVGNDGQNLDEKESSPAGCDNVIGVAALNTLGELALYSNYGYDVDIAAPGGEDIEGDDQPILVATNNGHASPIPRSAHKYSTGTSLASPIVAGVLSLMLSVNPELSNADLESLLHESARQFPRYERSQDCTNLICGSGMLDPLVATRLALQSYKSEEQEQSVIQNDQPTIESATADKTSAGCSIGNSESRDPLWLIFIVAFVAMRRKKQRG